MADVATRFRSLLLADSAIKEIVGNRVHQGTVPEDSPLPFIWFRRQGVRRERSLTDVGVEPFSTTFAVEPVAEDLETAQTLADEIRDYDGYGTCTGAGTFGDSTCKLILVEDQDDNYDPTYDVHDCSLSVEVVPT